MPLWCKIRATKYNGYFRHLPKLSNFLYGRFTVVKLYNPAAQGRLIYISRTKGLNLGVNRTQSQNFKKRFIKFRKCG